MLWLVQQRTTERTERTDMTSRAQIAGSFRPASVSHEWEIIITWRFFSNYHHHHRLQVHQSRNQIQIQVEMQSVSQSGRLLCVALVLHCSDGQVKRLAFNQSDARMSLMIFFPEQQQQQQVWFLLVDHDDQIEMFLLARIH